MNYIEDSILVDTYGGNFTWRDTWWEKEDGKFYVYEKYYGNKDSDVELINTFDRKEELDELIKYY